MRQSISLFDSNMCFDYVMFFYQDSRIEARASCALEKLDIEFSEKKSVKDNVNWKTDCNVVTKSWWKHKYGTSEYRERFTKKMVYEKLASACNKPDWESLFQKYEH